MILQLLYLLRNTMITDCFVFFLIFNLCLRKGTYIYLHFIQIRCSEIFVKHYAFKLGTKVYQITPTFDTNHSLFKPPLNSVPSSFLDSSLQESVNCSNQYHSITVCVWKKSSCTQETTTAQQKKLVLQKRERESTPLSNVRHVAQFCHAS